MTTVPFKTTDDVPHRTRLVKAAIVYPTDEAKTAFVVYTGWRHHLIFQDMRAAGCDRLRASSAEQGFVDEHGNFHNRTMSAKIAARVGQIADMNHWTVYSEQLWDEQGQPFTQERSNVKVDQNREA